MTMRQIRLFTMLLLLPGVLTAQSPRGKLSGSVRDAATREPLTGVNIMVEGTRLGAVTNLDGEYTVLNVPVGRHNVSASLLGYRKVTQTGVEVFIDRTSELHFRLSDESVELGEVTVVAQKPKIVKDQTSSSVTVDENQIRAAAVEGLRGVLDLTASFQKDAQGNYNVRGSGSYEVNYQVNGVSQINSSTSPPGSFANDKANNSWKYDVNPLGVQQVQLISGGFSAEYGNAQAGIVKVVTREGGPRFTGEIRYEYRPPGQYHFGPYLYDRSSYEWRKWGSIDAWTGRRDVMISELKLDQRYGSLMTGDSAARALFNSIVDREIAWAYGVWVNNHTPSDDNPLGVYDYRASSYNRVLLGFGGPLGKDPDLMTLFFSGEYRRSPTRLPTPERNQIFQNYMLSLTLTPVKEHKLKLIGTYLNYRGGIWSGSEDIRWSGLAFTPPGISNKYYILIDPVRKEQTIGQTLTYTYTISDHSIFEATAAHQYEKYELPYEYLTGYATERDRLDSLNDTRGTVLKDGIWWDSGYFRPLFNFSTNYYQDNRTDNWYLALDFTSQVTARHLIKAGVRGATWDMINNGVNSSFLANTYVSRSGFAEYYRAYPFHVAAYIQDKIEVEGFVANLGIRAEAYNFNAGVPVDPYRPFYQGTQGPGDIGNPATISSETRTVLMPRLGVSFPISENTAFRIQYGHFASMPIFSQGLSQRTQSGWIGFGNPNLEPKKTINYEFGLQQVLSDRHRLDVALYYNDRVLQVGTVRIASFTGSRDRFEGFTSDNQALYTYTTFDNNAFGSTVGVEMKFETIGAGNWSYRLSYNLSQTTQGNFGPSVRYPDNTRSQTPRNFTGEFLSSSDRTHSFRALVQYTFRDAEGPDVFGIRPLESTTLSLTYTAQSGTPFTYITSYDLRDVVNNRRYPLEASFDFNATRSLSIAGHALILGIRIMNVFDNKWLTPIDTDEDRNLWVQSGMTLEDPGAGNQPLRLGHVVAPYRAYRNIPRQVFFTIGASF